VLTPHRQYCKRVQSPLNVSAGFTPSFLWSLGGDGRERRLGIQGDLQSAA
jgi:hypothetical protein